MLSPSIYSSIDRISVFLIMISGFWLAFWVYSADRKAKINRIFFGFTLLLVLWTSFPLFFNSPTISKNLALWLIKLAYGTTALWLIPFYFFAVHFPREGKRYPLLDKIVVLAGIILFAISSFTNLHVKDIEIREWGNGPIFGPAKIFYFGLVFFFCLLVMWILSKKYSKLQKEEKAKIQYVLIGFFIFIFFNVIFNVLFPLGLGELRYYPLGNYSAIFLIGFTAYAIVKKELFGIKVVLTALLVGLISILLFLDAFFLTQDIALQTIKGIILIVFLFFGFLLIRATQEEVRRKEEAESLLKAKTEFLSIASHQLRTPLTAILGYSSMLKEGDYGVIPEKAGKALNQIYDSSQRMIKLVNDFLSVSRMETGKTVLKIKETSMNELINQVISDLELRAKERNLYVKYDRPATDHIIGIDPGKIKEVLSNLIDNAIHYTEKGGITVSTKENNARTTILVSDTGAGMTTEEIDKIFESFSRGSAGNELNTQGSGLGLYIAKKFVELHNGKIWAVSEGKDKGSIFYVELPNK